MKKLNLIISAVLLCLLFSYSHAQQTNDMFFATMQTNDAKELLLNHPNDIQILKSANGYSAVKLSDKAAEELHHKVLVHGPGFVYESSAKKAIAAIGAISKMSNTLQQKMSYAITQDALVRQSLDLVNNLNIADQIQEWENYGTRYHTTNTARQAILDLKTKWESIAGGRSDVSVRVVEHTSTAMPSLVMTITGSEKPDEFVVLGGHADSTAGGNNANAPGADDNASGIATITEAARVLFSMNFTPKRTIEFMAFAAEEVGLRGSREIAEDYRSRNVNVVSYMQLDMTNYKGSTNDAFISTDSYNDDTLNNFMISLLNHYNASGTHRITYGTSQCNYGCSDHYSWAQEGYPVTFPFEARFGEHNPHIHTTRDTFDRSPTPNATHAAKFAKLALEYLIEISNGVSGGPGGGDTCATSITTYPYQQSFESNVGSWTQSASDDLNWTVDSNGTPSNGTGPSNAAEGSSYIYVEASGNGTGFPNKRAILTSPCFDLAALSSATFSFKYHMQGSAIGNLAVEVSADNGTSWTSVFAQSGDQGSAWNDASVDLASYIGSTIQLRFNTVTGNSWQGDVAVDDVKLTESGVDPGPGNCTALNFNDFTVSSFSNQDNAGDFSVVNGGSGLSLQNNTWKSIAYDYVVTASTVIEFEFSSTNQGEIHGIGFEDDNSLTSSRYFKVHGSQNYGVTNYDNYSSGTTTYTIPVGTFYTGTMNRLVFVNDNDAGSGNTSVFSNVKIYEGSCSGALKERIDFGNITPVLGTEGEGILAAVKITPNPTTDSFTINMPTKVSTAVHASIHTLLGREIKHMELTSGTNTISAKQLSLQAGVYLITLETKGEDSLTQKIVIQ